MTDFEEWYNSQKLWDVDARSNARFNKFDMRSAYAAGQTALREAVELAMDKAIEAAVTKVSDALKYREAPIASVENIDRASIVAAVLEQVK